MKRLTVFLISSLFASLAFAGTTEDLLIKVSPEMQANLVALQGLLPQGSTVEDLGVDGWVRAQAPKGMQTFQFLALNQHPYVLKVQPNYKVKLLNDYKITNEEIRKRILDEGLPFPDPGKGGTIQDNPAIPSNGSGGSGADPEFSKQWGMNQMGVRNAWQKTKGSSEVVVAVIDTGVDYTHEDLVDNIWRNPGEIGRDAQGRDKSSNGVDDDKNGYIDDLIGWDFVSNDNKPFDLTVPLWELLTGGGNPGHGTHCAGNVGARADNGKGIAGVAPNIRIMPLRFLSEKGQGTTADAIKAVRYAVDNGADVTSNSWGSEGEDPSEGKENEALRDAIRYAQSKGSLFIAAAGNGHNGAGYNNDTDSKPSYPASYDMDVIVSVAAIAEDGSLGSFSNWGPRSVDLAAPGVVVFSTVPGGYQDTIADLFGTKVTWDGTSMATPHVAGAAALYLSANPNASWQEVKAALLSSVKKSSTLANKVVSGGQLDVQALIH